MSKKHREKPTDIDTVTTSNKNDRQDPLPLSLTERLGKKDTLDKVLEHYRAWLPRYQEFAQGRSDFQIEKLIATEHTTPAASYQHTLYQLRVMHQALINDFVRGIEMQRTFSYKWADADQTKPQWWEEGKEKKLCWYDTDLIRHQHELEELKMSVKDKLLQLHTFTKVLSAMEQKHGGMFTQAELDTEEPEYWRLRFARQMADEYLDKQTGLGTGNLKSLRMALADSPVPNSKNKIENFPDLINAVLSGRETGLEALNELNETLFAYMSDLGMSESKNATDSTPELKSDGAAESAKQLEQLQRAGLNIAKESH